MDDPHTIEGVTRTVCRFAPSVTELDVICTICDNPDIPNAAVVSLEHLTIAADGLVDYIKTLAADDVVNVKTRQHSQIQRCELGWAMSFLVFVYDHARAMDIITANSPGPREESIFIDGRIKYGVSTIEAA